MSYHALARKWRPRQFPELVGQEHVVRALRHALSRNQLHHALLFSGTRGVGKTTLGRLVAKGLNCEQGVTAEPCGQCSSCQEIDQGRFVDLIEVDAASRTGVDDTRDLLDNVQYAPAHGRRKVYLIDEVHMLSRSAFNALLKTLEEPPSHVQFLLATTDPQKLPVTVLSRCLQFHLKRLPQAEIQQQLEHILGQEGVAFEGAAVSQIARAADGSMRDGLSLLDQAIAYGGGEIKAADVADMLGSIERSDILALMGMLAASDAAQMPDLMARLDEQAPDYELVLDELAASLQQVALIQAVPNVRLADDQQQHQAEYASLAGQLAPEDVQLYYQIAVTGKRDMPYAPSPRSGFEMLLLRMLAFRRVLGEAGSMPQKQASSAVAAAQARGDAKAAAPAATTAAEPPPNVAEPALQADAAVPAKKAAVPLGNLDSQSWPAYVAQLSLLGMSAELARQCAWQGIEGKRVTLKLAPSFENLNSDRYRKEVEAALREQSGQDIVLHIELAEHELPTAAQCDAQAEQARMEQAEQALMSDPTVQALQERFGASVHPGSLQPHKST